MSSFHPLLTDHAIRTLCSVQGKPPPDFASPTVQVINLKRMPSSAGDRYRAVLSDGTHFVTSMLASQVTGDGSHLTEHCLVRVTDFMVNSVNGRTVLILLGLSVVDGTVPERLGQPTDIEKSGCLPTTNHNINHAAAQAHPHPLYNKTNDTVPHARSDPVKDSRPSPTRSAANPYGGNHSSSTGSSANSTNSTNNSSFHPSSLPVVRSTNVASGVTPIAALNMYNNRWTIQGRLTLKSDIRTWSNAKGEGSLFSIEILDSSMDIRATFFKEAVDKFYNMLDVGKVYSFSGGRLKVANMQYNHCKSQYEITLDQNAEIHLQNDDGQIAQQTYEFVKIGQLESVPEQSNVDVLAVVKTVGDPASLVSKKSGQELTKCDLTLVDDSGVEINLTVWGPSATSAPRDWAHQPVVAVRKARVSDFGGKSLSGGTLLRADLPEATALATWFAREGGTATVRSLSRTTGGGGSAEALTDRKSIAAIQRDVLGRQDKPDWLSFKATLSFVKKDKEGGAWYPACANAGEPCKNRFKCTQTTDGQWYCDKCQGTYPNPVRRWIFSAVVEDGTSSTWVSFFNEQAETLLGGVTADECFQQAYGGGTTGFDQDAYDSVFAKALFTEWIFKCKVKNEIYDEEARVKTSVYTLHPVDYVKESNDMLAALELW